MVNKVVYVNSKSIAAKARKAALEADRAAQEAKRKEDDYWRQAEGSKSRAAKKREQEAQKKAETAAKKAETRRLAEQEKKELEERLWKADKKTKVTEAELVLRKEKEEDELRRIAREERKKASRVVDEEEYEMMVNVPNVNRDDSIIEARTVEDALAHLMVAEAVPVEKHPDKRRKAFFKAFEEAELPAIKLSKPGLTHSQYKDLVWKLWKKCPENPDNMVKGAFNLNTSGVASCSQEA